MHTNNIIMPTSQCMIIAPMHICTLIKLCQFVLNMNHHLSLTAWPGDVNSTHEINFREKQQHPGEPFNPWLPNQMFNGL